MIFKLPNDLNHKRYTTLIELALILCLVHDMSTPLSNYLTYSTLTKIETRLTLGSPRMKGQHKS